MALTINTFPAEVITNDPSFNVTTSLTEGASYQNLRIRATIYQGGVSEAVAVLENTKNLDDWDLFDLLKTLIGKCDHAVGGTAGYSSPTLGSELLTGWTQHLSNFSTFTTSGRQITSAITSGGGGADYAKSNDLGTAAIGDVYIIAIDNGYTDTGTYPVIFKMSESGDPIGAMDLSAGYSGLSSGKNKANHIYFFVMTYADTTPFIFLGNDSEGTNFSGNFSIKKITDFQNNPGIYFTIKFEEVYENASDVTTIGAVLYSQSYLFVPMKMGPGESFTNYLITTSGKKWAQRQWLNGASNTTVGIYKTGIDMDYRIFGICVAPFLTVRIGTAYSGNADFDVYGAGWVMLVMNDGTKALSVNDVKWWAYLFSKDEARTSTIYQGATTIVQRDQSCYQDTKALSFIGDLGEETLLFRGMHTLIGKVDKEFYKNVRRMPKVLSAFKKKSMLLRMKYETEYVKRLVHELIYATLPVWMYDPDFTDGYREVTVLTDEAQITDQDALIAPEVEVEYYE